MEDLKQLHTLWAIQDGWPQKVAELRGMLAEKVERIRILEKALTEAEGYLEHDRSCVAGPRGGPPEACDCGLIDVLRTISLWGPDPDDHEPGTT